MDVRQRFFNQPQIVSESPGKAPAVLYFCEQQLRKRSSPNRPHFAPKMPGVPGWKQLRFIKAAVWILRCILVASTHTAIRIRKSSTYLSQSDLAPKATSTFVGEVSSSTMLSCKHYAYMTFEKKNNEISKNCGGWVGGKQKERHKNQHVRWKDLSPEKCLTSENKQTKKRKWFLGNTESMFPSNRGKAISYQVITGQEAQPPMASQLVKAAPFLRR